MMKRFSSISITLGLISIIGTIYHNLKLAELFQQSTGKTRALFGLTEFILLDEKLYIGLISLLAFTFALIAVRKKENERYAIAAIGLAVLSVVLLFIRFWRYFL